MLFVFRLLCLIVLAVCIDSLSIDRIHCVDITSEFDFKTKEKKQLIGIVCGTKLSLKF